MKAFQLTYSFFNHLCKANRRTVSFLRKKTFKIVIVFFLLQWFVYVTFLFRNINTLFRYSETDMTTFIKKTFLAFIIVHLLFQTLCVKTRTQNIKPYLLLNIKRKRIINYLIFKSLLNIINLIFIHIGIMITITYFQISKIKVSSFIVNILFLLIINNLIALYIQIKSIDKFIFKPIMILVLCILLFLNISRINYLVIVSITILNTILEHTIYISGILLLTTGSLLLLLRKLILENLKRDE